MLPVPRQSPTNTWDCGVFVCKFADAFYQINTLKDLSGKKPLVDAIANSSLMNFNGNDIEEMRIEMGQLIDKLSTVYHGVDGLQLNTSCTSERSN